MRLARVRLRNFRCYEEEVCLDIEDLTVLLGANDVGKSTFLDALAIFFGEKRIDQHDACVSGDPKDIAIICEFDDVPDTIVVDVTNTTSLADEYLLNRDGRLEIHHIYNSTYKTPKLQICIRAIHPSAESVGDLLTLKRAQLLERCDALGLDLTGVDKRINASLRAAIRNVCDDLRLISHDINTDAEGAKQLFPKILEQLPSFFIFSVDRVSTDQDAEAQDPMRAAVRLAVEQERELLEVVVLSVQDRIKDLTFGILDKLRAIDQVLASQLVPQFSPPRWESVFKINLLDDLSIPLNKRGSGVRRLVLLSFLQAQAEEIRMGAPSRGIIYAIEEPETSQHPDRQRALLRALEQTAEADGFQVILTTHTPNLIRVLPLDSLRFIERSTESRVIRDGTEDGTPELIRRSLGVLPDHDVRVLVGVEGPNDEQFLSNISRVLSHEDSEIESLEDLVDAGRVIFLPMNGTNLTKWPERLLPLRCREFYIFDRDNRPPEPPHYWETADRINEFAKCQAVHTEKRELENYLHPAAISQARGDAVIDSIGDFDDVPALVAEMLASKAGTSWLELSTKARKERIRKTKLWLNNEATSNMTPELLRDRGGLGEISGWLREITTLATESSV